jgi:glutaconyl-CoA/methylmalonyl-CoA decarboxylase subunit gamma
MMSKNIKFKFQDLLHEVQIDREGDTLTLVKDGLSYKVELIPDVKSKGSKQIRPVIERKTETPVRTAVPQVSEVLSNGESFETAPITGTILEIKVVAGQQVQVGDLIAIIEAMKMEIEIFASVSGSIQALMVNPGDTVKEKQPLLNISKQELI